VNRAKLIRVAKKLLQVEEFPHPAEVSIVLTTDEHIRQLNRDYRGKDEPTDVLSFQQLEEDDPLTTPVVGGRPPTTGVVRGSGPSEEPVVLGDVVISVDTAARQAAERGRALDDELALLVAHGILHLLGFDDETDEGAAEMREHEKAILGTGLQSRVES